MVSAGGARSSSISLEVDRHFVVIEEANPPSEMKRIVLPSELLERTSKQPAPQAVVERTNCALERT